jgi:hypothetical protein
VHVGLILGQCVHVRVYVCMSVGLIIGQCVYRTGTVDNVCVNTMDIA